MSTATAQNCIGNLQPIYTTVWHMHQFVIVYLTKSSLGYCSFFPNYEDMVLHQLCQFKQQLLVIDLISDLKGNHWTSPAVLNRSSGLPPCWPQYLLFSLWYNPSSLYKHNKQM